MSTCDSSAIPPSNHLPYENEVVSTASTTDMCIYTRIEYAREETINVEQQLQATQGDIAEVMDAAEQLTVEACALDLRRKELEEDEAALR
ncbi:hypothetical protein V7S43_005547 [Phytophthora oleae]|uniref:Uncharacterized protein n=1 Tax=Phytophthora oleae TaxID=2107226 RepID=A0ABD3FR45_9STRA